MYEDYNELPSVPSVDGKDVTLEGLQQANAARAGTLIEQFGVPLQFLQTLAIQIRLEKLVDVLWSQHHGGLPARHEFEIEDEQALANALDEMHADLVRQRDEMIAAQQQDQSGLALPTTPGTTQAPSGLIIPGGK